jgi:hypothetical protein
MVKFIAKGTEKRWWEDHYEDGESTSGACCSITDTSFEAPTMKELVKKIKEMFAFDVDDEYIWATIDESDGTTFISFNQLEDKDSMEPSSHTKELWKVGQAKLYSASYEFSVEKVEVVPVKKEDFDWENVQVCLQ